MNIPQDKIAHFLGGGCIAAWVFLLTNNLTMAFVITAIIGAAKEIYDHEHPDVHTCDLWDFIATIMGVIPLFPILIIR